MYVGFNLVMTDQLTEHKEQGVHIFEKFKKVVEQNIDTYVSSNGNLDGEKMQSDWFPQIEADVFISHSHNDQQQAIALAGWLYDRFHLTAFIDSLVWGYANDLLKKIDDEYCRNNSGTTYDYDKRNGSTSHVHSMLSSALTMMIDKSECLFFLNTPSSINTSESITKTKSPWIYYEIGMTKLIRKTPPKRKIWKKGQMEYKNESLSVEYRMNLDHLIDLSLTDLNNWSRAYHPLNNEHALDVLYQHKQISPQVLKG